MVINKTSDEKNIVLEIIGRLDSITSPKLNEELEKIFADGDFNLVLDFKELLYISSAGLRVMLIAQKKVSAKGTKLEIRGMSESVKEVFDMTGFSGFLNIV